MTSDASAPDTSIPGMRIRLGNMGEPWALTVRTAERQADWVLERRTLVDKISIKEVPTTILYQGQYFRVLEEEEADQSWIYRMVPCPDGEQHIHLIELSREWLARRNAERKADASVLKRAEISATYEILLGWLPSRIQEKMSERLLFSPDDASRKQSFWQFFIFIGLGPACIPMALVSSLFGFLSPLSFLLAFEGIVRGMHLTTSGHACGFLPGELIAWLWRRIARVIGKSPASL